MWKNNASIFNVIIVFTGCVLCLTFSIFNSPLVASDQDVPETAKSNVIPGGKAAVHLYFCDKDKALLKAEERLLDYPDDPAALGRNIIHALIRGPQEELVRHA